MKAMIRSILIEPHPPKKKTKTKQQIIIIIWYIFVWKKWAPFSFY